MAGGVRKGFFARRFSFFFLLPFVSFCLSGGARHPTPTTRNESKVFFEAGGTCDQLVVLLAPNHPETPLRRLGVIGRVSHRVSRRPEISKSSMFLNCFAGVFFAIFFDFCLNKFGATVDFQSDVEIDGDSHAVFSPRKLSQKLSPS